MRRLELRIPPLALCAAFGAATLAAGHFLPGFNLGLPGQRGLAVLAVVLAVVLGIVVAAAGVIEFRRARTTVNPLAPERASAVVASGVYRLSRNPMYLGMAIVLVGLATWQATLIGYALLPVFCGYLTAFQIKPEERALQASFGPPYARYLASVRRWV